MKKMIIVVIILTLYAKIIYADMEAVYDKATGQIITVGKRLKAEENQSIVQVPDYVSDNPREYKISDNVLTNTSLGEFYGKKIHTRQDVFESMNKKIDNIFSDPTGALTSSQNKEKLMAQLLCISLADNGHIPYNLIGVPGIEDKKTANDYILTILPKWLESHSVSLEANKFIIDNNL